jgi:hypothetical protein
LAERHAERGNNLFLGIKKHAGHDSNRLVLAVDARDETLQAVLT